MTRRVQLLFFLYALAASASEAAALPVLFTTYSVASPLSVSASPGFVLATYGTAGTKTTNTTTATPSGGQSPYSHSWTLVSGDASTYPTAPTGPITAFSRNVAACGSYYSTWQDVVTDAQGNHASTQVTANFVSTC